MGNPRIAVVLRYGLNPQSWSLRHERGEVVDRTPYAYDLANEWFTVDWSADHPEGKMTHTLRMTLRRALGFDLVHIWRNRRMIQSADAVWTHTEREHLAVALLKVLSPKRYQAASIAQSVWLWDQWHSFSGLRRRILGRLLRAHAVEIVLSRENRAASRRALSGRTVVRVPFGTHTATPAPADRVAPTPPVVLTVGNDRHRDWPLLLEVSRRMPEVDFDVVSLSEEVRALDWPVNVQVRSTTQRDIIENAYAGATAVAIPLTPNLHASGCTVAIEAVSAGLPIVSSRAGGIEEYLAGSAATFVAPGDADAFAEALQRAVEPGASTSSPDLAADHGLTESDYIRRLATLTLDVLGGRRPDPAIEAFASVPDPSATPPGHDASRPGRIENPA